MKRIVLLATAALTGCATYSGIIPEGRDSYLIIATAGHGLTSPVELKIAAHKQASEFCAGLNRRHETINEKTIQAGMLSDYSEYDLKFKCVGGAEAPTEIAEAPGRKLAPSPAVGRPMSSPLTAASGPQMAPSSEPSNN